MSAPLRRSIIICFIMLMAVPVLAEDAINYETIFDVNVSVKHKALWKIYYDLEQDGKKLLESRNVRGIFVGRYDDFADKFKSEAHVKLSLYRSPFQVKILFLEHYLKRLIASGDISNNNKIYLTINNYKDDYFNLYPHAYKKKWISKKISIIPNKLFNIDFFKDDRYVGAYQSLFDSVTEAVAIKSVSVDRATPKLLDKERGIKLNDNSSFNFYKVTATVNEVKLKSALEYFFEEMKSLADVIRVTAFYKNKYIPQMMESYTPRAERIISVNVVYNPDSDFDYHEMEYAKRAALLHDYFFRAGLAGYRKSPLVSGSTANLAEVQVAFSTAVFPEEALFSFEYDSDKDYYYDAITDFYDDLDGVMDVTEDIVSSNDINMEVIKLVATVDEIALGTLLDELKAEVSEYRKKSAKNSVVKSDE